MPDAPSRPRTRSLIAACVAVVVVAALGSGVALAASQTVTIADLAFAPPSVTVSVGDTVTWTNTDAQTHTATADDESWDAGNITGNGGTGAVVFTTAGSYAYHCTIHPTMTGTVVVEAAGATAAASIQPTDTAPIGATGSGGDRTLAAIVIAMLAVAVGATVLFRRPTQLLARAVPLEVAVGAVPANAPSYELPARYDRAAGERSLAPVVIVAVASAVAVAVVWRKLTSRG